MKSNNYLLIAELTLHLGLHHTIVPQIINVIIHFMNLCKVQ